MTKHVADRRGLILAAIRTSIRENGYPPTMRELAEAVGLSSTSSVEHHLRAMQRDGLIRRVAGSPRALVIADIHPHTSEAVSVASETASDPTNGATSK